MKYLIIFLSLVINTLGAIMVDFQWDAPLPSTPPQAIAKFNVYERTGATVTKVGETASGTTLTFRLNSVSGSTAHTYFVTAVGASGGESVPSNEVTVSAPPNSPVNLRITISITP